MSFEAESNSELTRSGIPIPFRVFIFENMAGQVFIVPITDSV
jgi:hypothetical protein